MHGRGPGRRGADGANLGRALLGERPQSVQEALAEELVELGRGDLRACPSPLLRLARVTARRPFQPHAATAAAVPATPTLSGRGLAVILQTVKFWR